MKKHLFPEGRAFYKANLHCHTVISDGKKTPEEIKAMYKKEGYDAVAFTDHEALILHDDLSHDVWTRTFTDHETYCWLYAQRRT